MIYVTMAVMAIPLAFILWTKPSAQAPTSATYTPATAPLSIPTPIGTTPTTNTPVTSDVRMSPLSAIPSGAGGIATTGAPSVSASPPDTTTTTGPPVIGTGPFPAAYVDPRFSQDPKNPLTVTYHYSAGSSILSNGVFLPVASIPDGTLTLFSNLGEMCSMSVGGEITGGTCTTTYPSFATYQVVANYVVNGSTYVSPILSDAVSAFSTSVVASIKGGGSLGGLAFDANVTDSNGNAVTTGSVSMAIADSTQGWSYNVTVANVGQDGANQSAFSCIFVENYPRAGDYSGCGEFGPIMTTPQSGDALTMTAAYSGVTDWTSSESTKINYTMP